jgi:hypothetical protein
MEHSEGRVRGGWAGGAPLYPNLLWKRKAVQTAVGLIVLLVMVWWTILTDSAGVVRASERISPVLAIPRLIQPASALPAPFMVPLPDTSIAC